MRSCQKMRSGGRDSCLKSCSFPNGFTKAYKCMMMTPYHLLFRILLEIYLVGTSSSISSSRRCSRRFHSLTEMEQQEAKRNNHADAVYLMAFQNRYEEANADKFASFSNTWPQEVHASSVHQQNGRWKTNTKN